MIQEVLVECSFYIPTCPDEAFGNSLFHPDDVWDWLDFELDSRFRGRTNAPGVYQGFYHDPDTGQKVSDESIKIIVAVPVPRLIPCANCLLKLVFGSTRNAFI